MTSKRAGSRACRCVECQQQCETPYSDAGRARIRKIFWLSGAESFFVDIPVLSETSPIHQTKYNDKVFDIEAIHSAAYSGSDIGAHISRIKSKGKSTIGHRHNDNGSPPWQAQIMQEEMH